METKSTSSDRRSWNTPTREPWNPIIKHCLNAVDLHVDMYLKTHDKRHMDQADLLREYVANLKDWIQDIEGKTF